MFKRALSTTLCILRKRYGASRRIPRDAHVDPARFSEEEFPVYCVKCGYLLRGLPDNKCPECGETFDRGRLLVQQCWWPSTRVSLRHTPTGRFCRRLYALGICMMLLPAVISFIGGPAGFKNLASAVLPGKSPNPMPWFGLMLAISYVGVLLFIVSVVHSTGSLTKEGRRRRRAILDAIER